MTDYIKREDAVRAMAQYMMDTALIDNPEASDRIEQWEGNIAAPVMSTVKADDVVEVVRCKDCKYWQELLPVCERIHRAGWGVNDYCSYGEMAEG